MTNSCSLNSGCVIKVITRDDLHRLARPGNKQQVRGVSAAKVLVVRSPFQFFGLRRQRQGIGRDCALDAGIGFLVGRLQHACA